jgi:phenylacetate-CoA ligase
VSRSNFLSEKIILPLGDLSAGRSIGRSFKFLTDSQFWTREQLDDYQNQRLRELIDHSYHNVPFYRELFDDLGLKSYDIQTKEDLVKLPVITKDDLKKNKDKHIAQNIKQSERIFSSSSGSTGEPFQYFKTKYSESFLKATAIRGWNWMGYRLGDPYVKLSMNQRGSLIKKIQDIMNNSLYLSSKQLINEEFVRIAILINRFNPKFIRGYPVPLYLLAKQYKEKFGKYPGTSLKALNTTGSTLMIKSGND